MNLITYIKKTKNNFNKLKIEKQSTPTLCTHIWTTFYQSKGPPCQKLRWFMIRPIKYGSRKTTSTTKSEYWDSCISSKTSTKKSCKTPSYWTSTSRCRTCSSGKNFKIRNPWRHSRKQAMLLRIPSRDLGPIPTLLSMPAPKTNACKNNWKRLGQMRKQAQNQIHVVWPPIPAKAMKPIFSRQSSQKSMILIQSWWKNWRKNTATTKKTSLVLLTVIISNCKISLGPYQHVRIFKYCNFRSQTRKRRNLIRSLYVLTIIIDAANISKTSIRYLVIWWHILAKSLFHARLGVENSSAKLATKTSMRSMYITGTHNSLKASNATIVQHSSKQKII